MQLVSTRLASPPVLRALLAAWLAGALAIFAFAGIMSLGAWRWVGVLIAVCIAACVAWFLWKRPVALLEENAVSPALSIVFVLSAILSLVQLGRLCVFIVNPAEVGYAIGPRRGEGLPASHLCMTAYYLAGKSATTAPNIYAPPTHPGVNQKRPTLESFDIDGYEYPPPFLLLPRALARVTPQFLRFRMLWFALYGPILLVALLAVARMFDPVIGTRAVLLSPLVLGADITVHTLQIENVQVAVVALAMLAMVFFTQRHGPQRTYSPGREGRYAIGGALLAFATLSKLFPGLLIVYLAVRREWRAVAWTLGMCVALVGISLLDMGLAPYRAFHDHLPRLLSGEGFGALRGPGPSAINLSVPGLLFKLKLFGLPNGSFAVMRTVGSIYSLFLLAATVVIGRRTLTRNQQPIMWLVILILASLRSPFLPRYGLFPSLWLLALLAATAVPAVRNLGLMLVAWLVLNIAMPLNGTDPRLLVALSLVSQAMIVVLLAIALRQRQESPQELPFVMQPLGSPS